MWQVLQFGMGRSGDLLIENAALGDWSSAFGQGIVQSRCGYINSEENNGEIVEEKIFKVIFKFITNGNYADQPYLRTRFVINKDGTIVDKKFYWFDAYTNSHTSFTSEVFGARILYDLIGFAPNLG